MNRIAMLAALVTTSIAAVPVVAQQAPAGATVVASEPGRVAVADTVKASAMVTAIDKATRTVTLKGPRGRVFDVIAGDEVRNFDQIAVGDEVVVQYVQALTLEVKKGGGLREMTESADAVRAKPGDKPAGAVGRKVTIVADVMDVNPKKKTITLKGPKGNLIDLDVRNPDHFKVVKKGDQVQAEYVEAIAIAVEPVAKGAGKK